MDNDSSKSAVKKSSVKLILAVGILLLPVVITVVIFTPFIISKTHINNYLKIYRLPDLFSENDILQIIQKMRDDREYAFYFQNISQGRLQRAGSEVYAILDGSRSKDKMADAINAQTEKVKLLAVLFTQLQYPTAFYDHPQDYPELTHALTSFLYEEFKLSIIGLIYKAKYDRAFTFQWDAASQEAARQLQGIIRNLGPQSRQQINL